MTRAINANANEMKATSHKQQFYYNFGAKWKQLKIGNYLLHNSNIKCCIK